MNRFVTTTFTRYPATCNTLSLKDDSERIGRESVYIVELSRFTKS